MKRDKPSSECKTFIEGFKAHGIDIHDHLSQQQTERYLELYQRHAFSQFEFYRNLIVPLNNSESMERDSFHRKLCGIEVKLSKPDGGVDSLFKVFWGWKPSSFTYNRNWYGLERVMFKSTPSSLPNPWPKNTEMVIPCGLYPTEAEGAYGYRFAERFPLLGELPNRKRLHIMQPAEFAKRKLGSIFTPQVGGIIGPPPRQEENILDVIDLLFARGAFILARITEGKFA